jgi:hypothetical protein
MAPASALALGRHEKVSNEESSIITALKKNNGLLLASMQFDE